MGFPWDFHGDVWVILWDFHRSLMRFGGRSPQATNLMKIFHQWATDWWDLVARNIWRFFRERPWPWLPDGHQLRSDSTDLCRWGVSIVFVKENPIKKWMMTRATPILGNHLIDVSFSMVLFRPMWFGSASLPSHGASYGPLSDMLNMVRYGKIME